MRLFFKLSLFFIILFVGIASIAVYHTFYNQLPDHTGTINIDGITQPADVHWDPYGVPYIYAETDDDLYFTMGYLHAQDRLWQLTLSQLMAEGRFAEFLGEEFLEIDIHQRTLGIWRTAQKIEQETPDEILSVLQRYADGINAYTEKYPRKKPVELTLLGLDPPRWTPAHSIAVSRLMAWDQNMHWKSEISLALIAESIGGNRLQQLFPDADAPVLSHNHNPDNSLQDIFKPFIDREIRVRRQLQKEGSAVGSNAWAVNGDRSYSGLPILAGDPHMGLSMPGFWYEVSQNSPGLSITGATIPGAPFVVLGQNQDLAWSITNMMADDTDFFLMQSNPQNPSEYLADSLNGEAVYNTFTWQQEIIEINGSDDYLLRIPHTIHGPLINSVHPDSEIIGTQPVAMRWAGHEISHELGAFYEMNRASDLDEFLNALSEFGSPAMNFIYADREDNIALIGAGNLPIRSDEAYMFRDGWNSEHRWEEWIPFDELPREINPDRGFVAHANNKVAAETYPYYIGRFWANPSRISRIEYLLNENESANAETMQQIQNDIYSEHAEIILEIIIPLLRSAQMNNEFSDVLTYFENWDYNYSVNSTAATIFDLFFLYLSELILKRDIPEELYEGLVRLEYIPVQMVTHILSDGSSFFNVVEEANIAFRNETVRSAMQQTIDQLSRELGPESFEWRWESVHTLNLKPPLLGEISEHPDTPAALRLIVNNLLSSGPHPAAGHGMTINKAEYSWNDPFSVILGPSIRRIIDFNSPSRSLSVLPTGQSGHALSANYGDQTDLWLDGRYRSIYTDSTFFNEINYRTMTLQPGNRR
ncbi:penicillin acylase family protein [Rhodohalobacter sp. SW132]|uniref:penicillin acylase family protein n=1 Tax=Rhodohalobacter sp. SW132 TaxID=2293433 RepID=UPI000E22D4F3|nr:penicillin acylase family protein [Rhodohalobacter sp. SW132]REL38171.1 penicillin acylase family protein [Rhodohalobacter sp. SW132]